MTDTCDVVFVSVPHGKSNKIVNELYKRGIKIIDLSADFRLKNPEDYVKWYGWEHPYPEMLSKSVYGVPEFHRDQIKNAKSGFMSWMYGCYFPPRIKTVN